MPNSNSPVQPVNGFPLVSIAGISYPATPSNLRAFYLENGGLLLSVEPVSLKIWPIDFKLSLQDRELLRYEVAYVHSGFKMNDLIVHDSHLNISLKPKFSKEDGYFLLLFNFTSLMSTEDYCVFLTPDDFEVLATAL